METMFKSRALVTAIFAAACLLGGFYFAPLLFFWFAGLLKLYDQLFEKEEITTQQIWINSALFIMWHVVVMGALKGLDGSYGTLTLFQLIILPACFLLHAFTNRIRPKKLGKYTVILFWFAIQYLFIKFVPSPLLFVLADIPSIPPEWQRWNIYTGLMGISLWIILVNFLIYQALGNNPFKWSVIVPIAILILIPIGVSYLLDNLPVTMDNLVRLYKGMSVEGQYAHMGEVVPHTAAWFSILIVIFTLVKNKTKK